MSQLVTELDQITVAPHTVRVWWLGGTGFIFKTPGGTQVYVDPYLSDIVAVIFDQPRGFPAPISAEDARPDLVIATHFHEDHLDPEALPIIAKHSRAQFWCPPTAQSRLLSWGIPRSRVRPIVSGESHEFKDLKIHAVPARHNAGIPGWETPDALGIILECGGVRIYHSGDTEFDVRLRALRAQNLDAALVVINGTGGNMNAHEAALLAWEIGAQVAVPMHHILWKNWEPGPEGTLDPKLFETTYQKLGGTGQVRILQVGESTTVAANDSERA